MFISVVLPAPFSPSSACTSPRRRSRSMWSLATVPGKILVIPRSSRTFAASAAIRAILGGELDPTPLNRPPLELDCCLDLDLAACDQLRDRVGLRDVRLRDL